jgi:hypothetical protein
LSLVLQSRRKKELTLSEKATLQDSHCRLESQIAAFNLKSQSLLSNADWVEMELREDEQLSNTIDDVLQGTILCMPSKLGKQQCLKYGWGSLMDQEKELRVGQANQSLEKIRLSLGHKSLLLRNVVRNASGQKSMTRAWGEVDRVDEKVKKEVAVYHCARHALISLGAEEELAKFRPIQPSDLKMSGDIVEENRIGQRNDALPWFWRIDGAGHNLDDDWMKECTMLFHHQIYKTNK